MTTPTAPASKSRMGRIVLQAVEEILGPGGAQAVLTRSGFEGNTHTDLPREQEAGFGLEYIGRLQSRLEGVYGPQAGRGLGLRVGRACLKYGLREFSSELGLADQSFRLLPVKSKIRIGSQAFAALVNTSTDQCVSVEFDEKNIFWHVQECPICHGRQVENPGADLQPSGPCCQMAVGLLQEALYWLSGGKCYEVIEEKCIACGDSKCTIVINQTPFD